MRTNITRGFTLVELLVVITIIGLLMAMSLPAVNNARESGRRVTCKSNIHQLALACLSHNSKQGWFPTGGWGYGWTGDADRAFGQRQPGGWCYNILPYLDQTDLHDLGMGLADADRRVQAAIREGTPLPIFNCPTRRRAITYPAVQSTGCVNCNRPAMVGRGDYGCNGGTTGLDSDTNDGPGSYQEGDTTFNFATEPFDGVIYRHSIITNGHLLNGASYVLLLGERHCNPDHYADGYADDDDQGLYIGFDRDNTRGTNTSYMPHQDTPGLDAPHTFGSAHALSFNAAFCDGSVRTILYSVDPTIYNRLGSRNSQTVVDFGRL